MTWEDGFLSMERFPRAWRQKTVDSQIAIFQEKNHMESCVRPNICGVFVTKMAVDNGFAKQQIRCPQPFWSRKPPKYWVERRKTTEKRPNVRTTMCAGRAEEWEGGTKPTTSLSEPRYNKLLTCVFKSPEHKHCRSSTPGLQQVSATPAPPGRQPPQCG